MNYFKLEFTELPTLINAVRYSSDKFFWPYPVNTEYFELAYLEKGSIRREYEDGEVVIIPENSFFFSVGDRAFTESCSSPNIHYCITTLMKCHFEHTNEPDTASAFLSAFQGAYKGTYHLTLPEYLVIDDRTQALYNLHKEFMNVFPAKTASSHLTCASLYLNMLSLMSELSLHSTVNDNYPPSTFHYAHMVTEYINNHISERIMVEDIANYIGISSGYLSQQFKSVMSCTLVDYINTCKINRVKDILFHGNASLATLCQSVGIQNESYLSRLFKKQVGVSIREYKRNQEQMDTLSGTQVGSTYKAYFLKRTKKETKE
ncbi:MAG: helix-turn-helix transcriptional regulator [Ruminococcaceae bacterium]|nr:helix-turn-helix transcriptional regulator [Oscillospiraceae bacterium]